MRKNLLLAAGLSLASLPVFAQPIDCTEGHDWDGNVQVDGKFITTGRTYEILASVCRRIGDTADSRRVWGVVRYLRNVNGTEHHYAHPECIRVFPDEKIVVLASRTRGTARNNWLLLRIDIPGKRLRALNMTQADALANCRSPVVPTRFPGQLVEGNMTLDEPPPDD